MAPTRWSPARRSASASKLTAANTAEQVDHLVTVLGEIDDRFGFRRPPIVKVS